MNYESTDRIRKLFFVFKKAVEAEQEAQSIYKEAISLCEDDECRNILEGFLEDEISHEKEIMIQYKKLREKCSVPEDA